MYIGPWQELKLARAIANPSFIDGRRSVATSRADDSVSVTSSHVASVFSDPTHNHRSSAQRQLEDCLAYAERISRPVPPLRQKRPPVPKAPRYKSGRGLDDRRRRIGRMREMYGIHGQLSAVQSDSTVTPSMCSGHASSRQDPLAESPQNPAVPRTTLGATGNLLMQRPSRLPPLDTGPTIAEVLSEARPSGILRNASQGDGSKRLRSGDRRARIVDSPSSRIDDSVASPISADLSPHRIPVVTFSRDDHDDDHDTEALVASPVSAGQLQFHLPPVAESDEAGLEDSVDLISWSKKLPCPDELSLSDTFLRRVAVEV